MSKIKIGIVALLIVIAVGIVAVVSRQGQTSNSTEVATVNGQQLSRSEYDARVAQLTAQSQGVATPEQISEQVVSQMISEELLLQDARSKGIEVSEEEKNAQFDTFVANFESREKFNEAMAAENLTEEQLRQNIHDQLMLEKYVDGVISENSIEVTEEEIVSAFEASIEGMENAPTLEEVREQVVQQVQQEKLGIKIQEIIQNLRNQADIQILL